MRTLKPGAAHAQRGGSRTLTGLRLLRAPARWRFPSAPSPGGRSPSADLGASGRAARTAPPDRCQRQGLGCSPDTGAVRHPRPGPSAAPEGQGAPTQAETPGPEGGERCGHRLQVQVQLSGSVTELGGRRAVPPTHLREGGPWGLLLQGAAALLSSQQGPLESRAHPNRRAPPRAGHRAAAARGNRRAPHQLGQAPPGEHAARAAQVQVAGAPAAHVEPLDGACRHGPVLPVQQDKLLLGTHGRTLQHPLQLQGAELWSGEPEGQDGAGRRRAEQVAPRFCTQAGPWGPLPSAMRLWPGVSTPPTLPRGARAPSGNTAP